MTLTKSIRQSLSGVAGLASTLMLLASIMPAAIAQTTQPADTIGNTQSDDTAQQLAAAGKLFADKQYEQAAQLYLALSQGNNPEQAAWAYELYGVCQEKLGNLPEAIAVFQHWLRSYPENSGQPRVQQRLLALETATMQPGRSGSRNAKSGNSHVYGSASLLYRGLTREVDSGDRETALSSLAGDMDMRLRLDQGDWLWRGRIDGGYLSDQSDDGESDGRISNLYLGLEHAPTGMNLTIGRQRSNDSGIYGYLDGAIFEAPITDSLSVLFTVGSTSNSTRESADTDRLVYAVATEWQAPDSNLKLQAYAIEQTLDSLTERRAVGGQLSWFSANAHYFGALDYDVEFGELNNVMLNASWNLGTGYNLALTAGYQRSPFLSASNAIIGEYDLDIEQFMDQLDADEDVYDAALDKTALSQYASLVLNTSINDNHRLIWEIYHYDLSELPRYTGFEDAPDSDASTTAGVQYVWSNALLDNDALSIGVRYTTGDTSDSVSLYADERVYFSSGYNITLRMRATQRSTNDLDQDALTLRPGIKLDYYFSRDLLLEAELGYEWLRQDFGNQDLEVQQAFAIFGIRKRF